MVVVKKIICLQKKLFDAIILLLQIYHYFCNIMDIWDKKTFRRYGKDQEQGYEA